jgi:succinate dehydrogenase / fumarate reductase cytochrome b subunit
MSSEVFQSYADELHSHPLIVLVFSLSLLLVLLAHIIVGLFLFYENRQVSNSRYEVTTRVVKNSFASATMPYTGLVILAFLFVHIFGFTFAPEHKLISVTVKELLSNFFYALFYIVAFIALTVHLSHGFWSMLQTFGVNHPRYNLLISRLTLIIPLFFLLIFGGIAFYFMSGLGASF